MDQPIEITLKNGILKPTFITLHLSAEQPNKGSSILLKVINDNPYSYSSANSTRKYIFMIQQIDQQSGALSPGDQYLFNNFIGCKDGKYHLTCINYPKLQCQIEIINEEIPAVNEKKNSTIINLSGLESVQQQKQEENKEELGRQDIQQVKSEQQVNQNPLGTPKKAELQHFDKILLSQNKSQQTLENRYLRYFQEEFKIWRNFFDQQLLKQQPAQKQNNIQQKVSTPIKQKPKSEHRKNSDPIEQNKIHNWSKRQNYSPDLKFTLSCGSASNNENFSEFQKQRSHLYSQQDYRIDDQLQMQKQSKTMKKTNSQYRLNIQDVGYGQKKDSQADTASKKKLKKSKQTKVPSSFLQWLDNWAETEQPVFIKQKQDQAIIKQCLSHIQNKYRIARFIYQ